MSEEEAALEDEREPEQMVRRPAISAISAQMAERLAPIVRGPAISAETAEKLGLTVQAAERLAASAQMADRPQSGKG